MIGWVYAREDGSWTADDFAYGAFLRREGGIRVWGLLKP